MKLYMSELMNANALSKAEPLKAKDLGDTYLLLSDAFLDGDADGNSAYYAEALCVGDEIDEEGCAPVYYLKWEIVVPNAEDEQNACDWDNPVEAKDGGLYDYNDGVITC